MFKSKLGRKNIVFFYVIVELICVVYCSIQESSDALKIDTNFSTELLLGPDELIKFLESLIPVIAQDCTDQPGLSPLMSIQPNNNLNEKKVSSLFEAERSANLEEYTETIDRNEERIHRGIFPCDNKSYEQIYSKMYLNHLKALKESGKMHRQNAEFQDLHPCDKLSYLQKNPPITGSILPDEPKIILRRKKPNLLVECTKKVEIEKTERGKNQKSFLDMLNEQKRKLRKIRVQDRGLRKFLSSYDLVIEELKAKLKTIKDRGSITREEKLRNLSDKLSGYKHLIDNGKSKLEQLEHRQEHLENIVASQRAVRSRVFEHGNEIRFLRSWYESLTPPEPQFCSTMVLKANRHGQSKNDVKVSSAKLVNSKTSKSSMQRFTSHLSVSCGIPSPGHNGVEQNASSSGVDIKNPEGRYTSRWRGLVSGKERLSSSNIIENVESGPVKESILQSNTEDLFSATYVEFDDDSDENENESIIRNRITSNVTILKLLLISLDSEMNTEVAHKTQSPDTALRIPQLHSSTWRGRISGKQRKLE
ncbi:uncharacterized protein ELE39_001756 [Cryptosporidium sp. chipmunk genotype I]|uniref:uncharacterized protein n=1 Tax=Cryptosporidium sp. chipmunk genotype I TaxID=1280935 RepID=UPI003519FE56|nr:hypothetical protein ELE39_001756 [Cryptosporidium sp. chipmunk genotype I]